MRRLKIDQVAVVDDRNLLCGRLRMRDLIAFAATSMLGDADGLARASDGDDAAGEGGSGQNANRWNTVLDVCGESPEGEEESGGAFDMRPGRGDVAGDGFVLTPRVQRESNTANDGDEVKERGHELPWYAATNTTCRTGAKTPAAPSMLARNAAHYTCKKTDSIREILEKFQRWDLTTMEVVGADGMLTGQLHVDDLLATLLNGTLELLPAEKPGEKRAEKRAVVDSGVHKESLVRR